MTAGRSDYPVWLASQNNLSQISTRPRLTNHVFCSPTLIPLIAHRPRDSTSIVFSVPDALCAQEHQIQDEAASVNLSTGKTKVQAFVPTVTLDMTAVGLVQQPRDTISQASTMLIVSENRWNSFLRLRAFAMEFSRQMNLPDVLTSTDEMKCSFRASNDSNVVVEMDVSLAGHRFCISSRIHRLSGFNKEASLRRVQTDQLCQSFLSLGSLVQLEDSFLMRLSVPTDDLNYSEFRDTLESFCDTCQFVKSILEG